MKTLDRYVLSAFLKNYLIAFFVLIGMFVILDMVFKFDDIVEVQSRLGPTDAQSLFVLFSALISFYFYKTFLFFLYLGPVIPGVAASFTLLRLTRNNELVAVMVAGVPLLRVATPIIIAAVVLSGLGAVDQELIIPNIIPQLMLKHSQLAGTTPTVKTVPPMRDSENRILMAARYYTPSDGPPAMDFLDVIGRDDKMRPTSHLYADRAIWNPDSQQWDLTNGVIVQGLLPEQRPTDPTPVATLKTSITPDEIALFRSGDYVDLLSTARIRQLLQRSETYGAIDLLRVMHSRYAQLLLNIVLLLLAIPSVLTREPSKLRLATAQALGLTGACLGTVFLSHNLAGQLPPNPAWTNTWPALMAWMPVFIFGPLSVYLLDRVKS
ncbi:MAG TPA: LptF/LptG family permease [Tepidisphaeraceae bacterium]|jgi:lipopolysaccharide export system permease protein|nr:LptF/LptG family permease [Tepidisphaeraceae bacterium]